MGGCGVEWGGVGEDQRADFFAGGGFLRGGLQVDCYEVEGEVGGVSGGGAGEAHAGEVGEHGVAGAGEDWGASAGEQEYGGEVLEEVGAGLVDGEK